jgi:hypothetical protein
MKWSRHTLRIPLADISPRTYKRKNWTREIQKETEIVGEKKAMAGNRLQALLYQGPVLLKMG